MPRTVQYENLESTSVYKDEMVTILSKKTGFTKTNVWVFMKALEEMYSEFLRDDKGFLICRGVKLAPYVLAGRKRYVGTLRGFDDMKVRPEYLEYPPSKTYRLVINENLKKEWNTPEERAKFVRSSGVSKPVGRPRKNKVEVSSAEAMEDED